VIYLKSEVIKKILDNNLKLIHIKNKSNQITVRVHVCVGSSDETTDNNGISHFLEHMLWQGTKNHTANSILRKLKEIDANHYALTNLKRTIYMLIAPKRHFEKMIKLMLDIIQNPSFDITEINRERNVILDEYKRGCDNPYRFLISKIFSELFKDHPLSKTVIGSIKNIKKFTRKDLITYHKKYYVPNNMIILVEGNIEDPEKLINKYFYLKERKIHKKTVPKPIYNSKKKVIYKKNVSATYLGIGFKTPEYTHKDICTLQIINYLLNNGNNINLNNIIRQKLGLTYNINSENMFFQETGLFVIKTTTDIKQLDVVIDAIFTEINKFQNIKTKELSYAKNKLIKETKNIDKYPFLLNEKIVLEEIYGYTKTNENKINDLRAVTIEDIKRVSKKYFNNYVIDIIKPKK